MSDDKKRQSLKEEEELIAKELKRLKSEKHDAFTKLKDDEDE